MEITFRLIDLNDSHKWCQQYNIDHDINRDHKNDDGNNSNICDYDTDDVENDDVNVNENYYEVIIMILLIM